jgi:hypothetical protein
MSRSRSKSSIPQEISSTQPAPFSLDEYVMKPSPTEVEGRAYGELLAQAAARIMLTAYNERQQPTTPASDASNAALEDLRTALAGAADLPHVDAALREFENAHNNALVEIEDRAWHAAWTVATSLRAGVAVPRVRVQR